MSDTLENLYDKMLDEAPFNFKEANKPYIFELAKIYATECVKASLEKASEKGCDSLELYNSEYEKLEKAITNPENITLL